MLRCHRLAANALLSLPFLSIFSPRWPSCFSALLPFECLSSYRHSWITLQGSIHGESRECIDAAIGWLWPMLLILVWGRRAAHPVMPVTSINHVCGRSLKEMEDLADHVLLTDGPLLSVFAGDWSCRRGVLLSVDGGRSMLPWLGFIQICRERGEMMDSAMIGLLPIGGAAMVGFRLGMKIILVGSGWGPSAVEDGLRGGTVSGGHAGSWPLMKLKTLPGSGWMFRLMLLFTIG